MSTLRELLAQTDLGWTDRLRLDRALAFPWSHSPNGERVLRPGVSLVVGALGTSCVLLAVDASPVPSRGPAAGIEPAMDDAARSSIAAARTAATGALAPLLALVRERPVFEAVISQGADANRLQGASAGLALALANWSAIIDKPLPTEVVASAQVRPDGTLAPVKNLDAKALAIAQNAPSVKRFLVSTDQPSAEVAALKEAGFDCDGFATLNAAAAFLWERADTRIKCAEERLGRVWETAHEDVRTGSLAALAARLTGNGVAARRIRDAVRLRLGPRGGVATVDEMAVAVALCLAVGDFDGASTAARRLAASAPTHPLVVDGGFSRHQDVVLDAIVRHREQWQAEALTEVGGYIPRPIDTSSVALPAALAGLVERLARNNHDHWAQMRIGEGWTLGPRDDAKKTHPGIVPYELLSEGEKEYDRRMAVESLKAVIVCGYQISEPRDAP